MNSSRTHRRRYQSAAAAALVAIGLTAFPASAVQDQAARQVTDVATTNEGRCSLARVGTQFVRCDNLTGNGVAAPAWVPER